MAWSAASLAAGLGVPEGEPAGRRGPDHAVARARPGNGLRPAGRFHRRRGDRVAGQPAGEGLRAPAARRRSPARRRGDARPPAGCLQRRAAGAAGIHPDRMPDRGHRARDRSQLIEPVRGEGAKYAHQRERAAQPATGARRRDGVRAAQRPDRRRGGGPVQRPPGRRLRVPVAIGLERPGSDRDAEPAAGRVRPWLARVDRLRRPARASQRNALPGLGDQAAGMSSAGVCASPV